MLMGSRNGPVPGTALRDTLREASDLVGISNSDELWFPSCACFARLNPIK